MKAFKRELDPIATGKLRAAIRDLYDRLVFLTDWRKREPDFPIQFLCINIFLALLFGDNNIKRAETTSTTCSGKIQSLLGSGRYFGTPSDTTMLWALRKIDDTELLTIMTEWCDKWFPAGNEYAIDGKAVRACLEKAAGMTHSPYILNAFSSDGGRLAAQLKIGEKSNELAVVRTLFHMLPMEGALITTDAFATYAHVVDEALKLGAHCLMPIKDNQESLNEDAMAFFQRTMEEHPELIRWHEDKDNNRRQHGRIEFRKTGILTQGVEGLVKGTKFEGLIAGIAFVSRERTVIRREAEDVRSDQTLIYLYTKADMTAEEVATAVRGHWAGCEVVHYVLDTEFDEDLSTVRKDNGMQNLSCLRKCAYALLHWINKQKKENDKVSFGSFGAVRMILRDLAGIPKLTDVEYRKLVRELTRADRKQEQEACGNKEVPQTAG